MFPLRNHEIAFEILSHRDEYERFAVKDWKQFVTNLKQYHIYAVKDITRIKQLWNYGCVFLGHCFERLCTDNNRR